MRYDLFSALEPRLPLATVELDPARIRGSRNAFGPMLHVGVQVIFEQGKNQPFLFEGMLCWPGENVGLMIPLQTVGGGTAELNVPISDHQIASLERKRAGKELRVELNLRAVGTLDESGVLGRYANNNRIAFDIPRDKWKDALNAFGVGMVRIIELPVAPPADEPLKAAAHQLGESASFFAEGRYGEAIVAARTSLERMVESIGSRIGMLRGEKNFSPFVEELSAKLKNHKTGDDPFALIGGLVRTAFGWTSHPAHQGFHVSERDDALFAINLCTALYSYIGPATGWGNLQYDGQQPRT